MSQVQLCIGGLDRHAAHAAADALGELIEPVPDGLTIFESGADWHVTAYYVDQLGAEDALAALRSHMPAIHSKAVLEPVPDENWVALSQAALPPVMAGRFTICGSHDLHRLANGPNTLVIEAGEAFGTAHHATTYGCLLAIDRLTRTRSYRNVLDLGCGSGILALAAQRCLPKAHILAVDIDRRSVEVARENARANRYGLGSPGPKFVYCNGAADPKIQSYAPFDLAIANILAGPLINMGPRLTETVASGGTLLLSGILVAQAREVVARYVSLGMALRTHHRHDGWSTLVFSRCSPRSPDRQKPPGGSPPAVLMEL